MIHERRLISLLIAGSILLTGSDSSGEPADDEEWIALFNGQDLGDWIPKIRGHPVGANYANTFRVEDGLFTVSYDGYEAFNEQFGHIFYKDPFSYCRLLVEYRFIGKQALNAPDWAIRNSGVMVHSQDPETMPPDQDFPISLEAQFLGGNGTDDRPTANLCTPGTHVEMEGTLEGNVSPNAAHRSSMKAGATGRKGGKREAISSFSSRKMRCQFSGAARRTAFSRWAEAVSSSANI